MSKYKLFTVIPAKDTKYVKEKVGRNENIMKDYCGFISRDNERWMAILSQATYHYNDNLIVKL